MALPYSPLAGRDYIINGPALVWVQGGAHNPYFRSGGLELGLTAGNIRVTPRFFHKDIIVDDFGQQIGPENQWQMADCRISMNLVHYDKDTLQQCVIESTGGTPNARQNLWDGTLGPGGMLLGRGQPRLASGNRYLSLNIQPPTVQAELVNFPWRFPTCYLTENPVEWPLGTQVSVVQLNWRAVPYYIPFVTSGTVSVPTILSGNISVVIYSSGQPLPMFSAEIVASGQVLWDHILDPNKVG